MTAIELIKIKKYFKDGPEQIEALKETNLTINKGEFVAVIGPSGSGKSTFLTIIGGLQSPSQGEVRLNGQSFSQKKEKERAKMRFDQIGFILQASNLVPFLKIKDQLRLVDKVDKKKQRESIDSLFAQLGITDIADKYPEEISGGQRQRVAIARALYNDPTIILADEPTASLDTEKAMEVVKILADEAKEKNKAVLMVTHDRRLVAYCDRLLVMEDGVLREEKISTFQQ
ncbi:ABC transporter ATP-binding protein [Streptococcus equinus]|jgi:putative ABC transport system ATP-binding protein|uniref:ABC transporter ATP-binding protein n=1 Tax=Streptococcus equinus TaxID=1335 RepID=UPI000871B314|nr:ABC transporter ATP-binding protein [Streptococcus equinus]MBE6162335.1 ABC transporter ATP-binding protein [Streptococcus equinus]MEE0949833.1 ABC transporter ATP-binding protein [Streptococcus equinus]SCW51407.1 putative ABC transport system ATP-binding protein [Streptococcus equinus]SDQ11007.1 putative ABC transport system ATP-binding protein [Streptococcus equinus]SDQ27374.1 putative ABC transport system ATP-binding protein [Streptococcus equinus]